MRLRLFIPVSAALAVLLLNGCSKSGDDENQPTPLVSVQAEAARLGPVQHWVHGEAVLSPRSMALITPKITAPVAHFEVDRGSHVHTGDLVAQLENRDLVAAQQEAQSDYEAAQAAYQTAMAGSIPEDLKKAQLDEQVAKQQLDADQKIYDSRKELYGQGAIPQRDLNQAGVDLAQAQSNYQIAQQHRQSLERVGNTQAVRAAEATQNAAKARLEAAQAQVGYSMVKSPIDGVVTDRPVYTGELATTSTPLMTIMDLSQVLAKTHLPASEATLLHVGDAATLTGAGISDPVNGKVTVVSSATDTGSTTVEVWVQAANPGEKLRPGTTVQVTILAQTIPNTLSIPATALLTDPSGETTVMVLGADNKSHERKVEAGIRDNDRVQITSGLKAGEQVITVGAYGLNDQTPVKVEKPSGQ